MTLKVNLSHNAENLCWTVRITSLKCVLFPVVLPKSKSPSQFIDVGSDDPCLSLSGENFYFSLRKTIAFFKQFM